MGFLETLKGNYFMIGGYVLFAVTCVSVVIGSRKNKKDFRTCLPLLFLVSFIGLFMLIFIRK